MAALVAATNAVAAADTPDEPEVVGVQLVQHPDQVGMGRRGVVSIVAQAAPGDVVQREVIVSNDTRDSQAIDIYVGGAIVEDATFTPADEDDRELTLWSSMSPPGVVLEPGEESRSTLRIAVPADAANGEYYGVVWVQPPASTGPIREVNRVGVRIYLTIVEGGTAPPPTDFVIDSLTATTLEDGRRQVTVDARNTGQRAVDLVGELSLTEGPGGLAAGPFPTDAVTTVEIGGQGVVTVTLDGEIPAGPWLAQVTLSSGALERRAEAEILFPSEAGGAPPADAETTGGTDTDGNDISDELRRQRRALLPLAALLILLAIAALWLMLLWRRRQEEEDEDADNETAEVVHDG